MDEYDLLNIVEEIFWAFPIEGGDKRSFAEHLGRDKIHDIIDGIRSTPFIMDWLKDNGEHHLFNRIRDISRPVTESDDFQGMELNHEDLEEIFRYCSSRSGLREKYGYEKIVGAPICNLRLKNFIFRMNLNRHYMYADHDTICSFEIFACMENEYLLVYEYIYSSQRGRIVDGPWLSHLQMCIDEIHADIRTEKDWENKESYMSKKARFDDFFSKLSIE